MQIESGTETSRETESQSLHREAFRSVARLTRGTIGIGRDDHNRLPTFPARASGVPSRDTEGLPSVASFERIVAVRRTRAFCPQHLGGFGCLAGLDDRRMGMLFAAALLGRTPSSPAAGHHPARPHSRRSGRVRVLIRRDGSRELVTESSSVDLVREAVVPVALVAAAALVVLLLLFGLRRQIDAYGGSVLRDLSAPVSSSFA